MADSTKNSSMSRIAFTLPISCQICLGKVKQPVVCPNQHAFCSPCMEIWLQRNEQCPSCRVEITSENPCKKILGGLSHNEEEATDFSKNKELRRSRLELLCKDYEDEIERLEMENEALDHEKTLLREQLKSAKRRAKDGDEDGENMKASSSSSSSSPDVNMLMVLTKKLHDATGLYEKVKKDMDKLKLENSNVKDENANISRENQRLRMELVGRSPRKFGRFTVATLETKVEEYEKEMQQLKKALERSDAYVEDVEKELESYRKKFKEQSTCVNCKRTTSDPIESQNKDMADDLIGRGLDFGEYTLEKLPLSTHHGRGVESHDKLSEYSKGAPAREKDRSKSESSSDISEWKKPPLDKSAEVKSQMSTINFYGKKPLIKTVDEKQELGNSRKKYSKSESDYSPYKNCDTSSFDLEMPSMYSPCSSDSLSRLDKMALENDDSFIEKDRTKSNDTTSNTKSPTGMAKKKLKFESSDISDASEMSFLNGQKKGKGEGKKSTATNRQVTFNRNVSVKNMMRSKSSLNDSLLDVTLPSETSEVEVLNDTKPNTSSFGDDTFDINNSMNSDIMDCMELFDSAERRLGQKKSDFEPKSISEKIASNSNGPPAELPSSSSDFSKSMPVNSGAGNMLSDFPQPFSSLQLQPHNHLSSSAASFPSMTQPLHSSHIPKQNSGSFIPTSSTSSLPYFHPSQSSSTAQYQNTDIQGRNPSYNNYQAPTSNFNGIPTTTSGRNEPYSSDLSSKYFSGSMGSFRGSGTSESAINDPLKNNLTYPSRPASTSTLHNMLQRLNTIESENTRPTSAPGLGTLSSTDYRTGVSSSSARTDFSASSSMSNVPNMSRSIPTAFESSMFGSGMSGVDMSRRNFSTSQSSLPTSAIPGLPGMVPGLPGGSLVGGGLSQPAFGFGNDFSQGGGAGYFGQGFGAPSGFNGGFTQ